MTAFKLPLSLQESLEATKIEYVQLGSSGLQISWPILGAMGFGQSPFAPWLLDEDAALAVLKAAFEVGLNTIDTAPAYCNGLSEKIIGKALRRFDVPRHKVVLITKCGYPAGENDDIAPTAFGQQMRSSKEYVNQVGTSRNAIFNVVDGSLERLGTTYIDLLQIQRLDGVTPPQETMKALHDVVQSGKVRYIGASSMWATEFAELQFVAEKHCWTKFVSMQNYYNLCYREEEREMIRFCKKTGVAVIPWSPLYAGRLGRPAGDTSTVRSERPSGHHPSMSAADEEIIGRVQELAEKKGWTMSEVALVWHKCKGTVPIVGLNSVERVGEMCGLRGKALTEEEAKFLEEPYVARPIAGHL